MVEQINNRNEFTEKVLNSKKTVLVDFFAPWCGPCKQMSPIVDRIAGAHPEIDVFKVNTDDNADIAIDYSVMSIPTLIVFKDGDVANRSVGSRSYAETERLFESI